MELYSKEDNFTKSLNDASKHKRSRASVVDCFKHSDETYQYVARMSKIESHYIRKTVIDEPSGKVRDDIYVPAFFPTQIQQHMVRNVCEHALTKGQWPMSCGSIKGRGPAKILRYLSKKFRVDVPGTRYFVKFDIRKFYNNVSHQLLEAMIRKKIKDGGMIAMLESDIVASTEGGKGLKIGTFTSPLFANFFLTEFDHFVKEAIGPKYGITEYTRYVDDFIIFGANARKLERSIDDIRSYLSSKLLVQTHLDERVCKTSYLTKDKKFEGRDVDYVGYRFFRDHIEIRKRDWKRIRRCLLRIKRLYDAHQRIPTTLVSRFWSYWGYIVNSDSKGLVKKYTTPQELKYLKRLARQAGKERKVWKKRRSTN